MFNKNVFTQTDAVADLIKGINEADYKAKMEALRGNQHKIDKNKNGKVDAHDFKILRGEKKVNEDQVEEGNNPFDVKNYKSQLPTKPGEKAGFDSKKISTGTVYTRKPVKDEPMKKEEVEQVDEMNKDTLYSYAQKSNKDMEKKHKELAVQVRANKSVEANRTSAKLSNRDKGLDRAEKRLNKEEYDQVDEAGFDPLKHIKNPNPAVKAAAKDVKRSSYADRAALMKAGGVKDDRGPRGVTQEEVEQVDERTLTSGETSEKERIVKGMKKSLSGFKARYGKDAKSVMYATATKSAKKD